MRKGKMQKIRKQTVSVAFMAIFIIGSIYILGIVFRPTNTDSSVNAIDTFHDLPEDSIQVIGYGSSRMWRGVSSMEMYENYGIGMYNYGCNWQLFNTTYLFFLDSLQTQSPDVVIFEVKNVCRVREDEDMGGEIYYTTAINGWDIKAEYIYQCFGNVLDRYISYLVPIFGFHESWKDLEGDNFTWNSSEADFYQSMGYLGSDKVTSVEAVDYLTFDEIELNESAIEMLDEIVEICNENEIEIIFYVAPYSGEYKYSDAMAEYAEENGCVYLDGFEYIEELGIDWETDFYDNNHLNNAGVSKMSNFLGEYIVENYDVMDMREIEGNIWEENLE